MTLLEVKNLHTHFFTDNGVVRSVDGVDFKLEKHQTLGIVGESGSGKSVTALSIMGLLQDTTGRVVEGEILLNGVNILKKTDNERRLMRGSDLAMIFQEPMTSLNPVLTIGDQIGENLTVHHPDMTKEEVKKRVIQMLEAVSIPRAEKIYDDYPYELSGGMRQRVMIALAMICQPQILIADEPTTALDVTIQAQIIELIKHMRELYGMSILFITHDLGVVAELCDQVIVMYCGRIVEKADVMTLFKAPKHPYTQGLLKSIPQIGERREYLDSIRGQVPSPRNLPPGCKFAPRCDACMNICEKEEPPFFDLGQGQYSRCWLCKEGQK